MNNGHSGKRIVWSCLSFALLSACVPMTNKAMSPESLRAYISECRHQNLGVLVYRRADGSVVDVACIPHDEEVDQAVTVRARPMLRLLWPFLKKEVLVPDD